MQKVIPYRLERLQEILEEMVADGFVSGASCMAMQYGRELCYFESGYRDIAAQAPLTRDTIFRFYSMTKPVTAVAVMMLIEEGRLDLLAPVYDYFPNFRDQYYMRGGEKIPVQTPVQIRHLLNMTAGISYPGGSSDETDAQTKALVDEIIAKLHTDEALATAEIASRIGEIPLLFEPGTRWNYGLCADVLGAIVEKISGMRFGEFLRKRIFEPLGMTDTGFYVPREKQGRLAKVYDRDDASGFLREREPDHLGVSTRMEKAPAFESGGAGLAGTIDDAHRARAGGGRDADYSRKDVGISDERQPHRGAAGGACLGKPAGLQLRKSDARSGGAGAGRFVWKPGRVRLGRLAGRIHDERSRR